MGHVGMIAMIDDNFKFLLKTISIYYVLFKDFWPNGGSDQPGCPRSTFTDIIVRAKSILSINFKSYDAFFKTEVVLSTDACSHLRAVELYAESVRQDFYQEYQNAGIAFFGQSYFPSFKAVRCSRLMEFDFLFYKVKFGKLQCTTGNFVMGIRADPSTPSGNYYFTTNSEYVYALEDNGTRPYLDGNAPDQEFGFH